MSVCAYQFKYIKVVSLLLSTPSFFEPFLMIVNHGRSFYKTIYSIKVKILLKMIVLGVYVHIIQNLVLHNFIMDSFNAC